MRKNRFTNKTIIYIFNIIAVIVLLGTIGIYSLFQKTSVFIKNTNRTANIEYIDNITSNVSQYIIKKIGSDDFHATLKQNKTMRQELEHTLSLLITQRYRYVYVVDKIKNKDSFRFLLDGASNKEDKSEFDEEYIPMNLQKWDEVYKTHKTLFFKHHNIKSLWLTYLKPIVVHNKVVAILVVDFSLEDHNRIIKSLHKLNQTFEIAVGFSIFIFFIIILFAYIDNNRIKELKRKSSKISRFNTILKEKVKEEVEKNRQKDQHMVQQNRLAQMGEMISMIAHQWRQPLTAISSTSSALRLKAQFNKLDNTTVIELSDNISRYAQHLSCTIDDFREFFKKNKDKNKASYDELIQGVLDIVETSIKNKNITIKKDFTSTEIFCTYTNEVKQVILNLLKNAEDVLLENNIENPTITIKTYHNILEVSDNAGGVPEDIIDKIFDPYFSTKTKKDGTGLGLYMSRTIIHEHCKGELKVANNKEGAVFTITLPSS